MRTLAHLLLFVLAIGVIVPSADAWPKHTKKPDYRYKTPNLKYKKPKIKGHSAHKAPKHHRS